MNNLLASIGSDWSRPAGMMINPDDLREGIKELVRAARLGLSGAMITEYPLECGAI